jgi:hypothetical protein
MSGYIIGIDPGVGKEYAGETILTFRDGKWVIESMRVWEVTP